MNYQTIRLGAEAKNYIIKCLGMGLTMGRSILRQHDINTGEVVACLDDFVDSERIQQLTVESLRWSSVSDTGLSIDCLIDSIIEHLSKSDANVCILEDADSEPQFTFMQKETSRYMVHEKEVYFVLTPAQRSRKEIDAALITSQSLWLFIGAMTSIPEGTNWEGKKELSKEELEDLAARAEKVFVAAFDREGYLMWSKPEVLEHSRSGI